MSEPPFDIDEREALRAVMDVAHKHGWPEGKLLWEYLDEALGARRPGLGDVAARAELALWRDKGKRGELYTHLLKQADDAGEDLADLQHSLDIAQRHQRAAQTENARLLERLAALRRERDWWKAERCECPGAQPSPPPESQAAWPEDR